MVNVSTPHRIPYVRFDGQMSARKRQEVLEKFNVPLNTLDVPSPRKRNHRSSAGVIIDEKAIMRDGDFVMDAQSDDDADSFLDNSDDDSTWTKKGKGKIRTKPQQKSAGSTESLKIPVVMLISLKAGALGLNLTIANNVGHSLDYLFMRLISNRMIFCQVYLWVHAFPASFIFAPNIYRGDCRMDPWWQEGIESQAIDRCNRIGQTKPVHVYQFVAENTVEAKVIPQALYCTLTELLCPIHSRFLKSRSERKHSSSRWVQTLLRDLSLDIHYS